MSYEYQYTGDIEGMVPGVGLVEMGKNITPTDPEHEERIKATGLFKRVKAEAKADEKPTEKAPSKAAEGAKDGNA